MISFFLATTPSERQYHVQQITISGQDRQLPTNSDKMGIKEDMHGELPPQQPRLFFFELLDDKGNLALSHPYTKNSANDEHLKHSLLADDNNEKKEDTDKPISKDDNRNYFFQLKVAKDAEKNKTLQACSPVILGEELEKKKGRKCVCEIRIRAFMRMIRVGEGTSGEKGYTTAFGGKLLTDLSKHPEKDFGGSTAAGAYQIMRYTYWSLHGYSVPNTQTKGTYVAGKDLLTRYKVSDYSPESQDKICIIIMKHSRPGLLWLIQQGKTERAIREIASSEWASLPNKGDNSRYSFKGKPQRATKMNNCLTDYEEFYNDELAGNSDLHLQPEFLELFHLPCKCKVNILEPVKIGYDVSKAVMSLTITAENKSKGYCARYVRWAIEAGGLSTEGRPASAKDYDKFLPILGFVKVDSIDYEPIEGDIAVFEAFHAGHKYHEHGHIQMYNGYQWVSDFKQRDFWAGSDYRNYKPSYKIFRWE